MAPWTSAWICCLQPYHPCKNRTHNISFYNTEGGHTPNGGPGLQILDVQTAIFGVCSDSHWSGGCVGRTPCELRPWQMILKHAEVGAQPEGCAGHTPWAICGGGLGGAPRGGGGGVIANFADTHFLPFFCAVTRFSGPRAPVNFADSNFTQFFAVKLPVRFPCLNSYKAETLFFPQRSDSPQNFSPPPGRPPHTSRRNRTADSLNRACLSSSC